MKVCIPTLGYDGLEDFVYEHFGKAPTFTIYNTETNEVKVIENKSEHFGGKGLPAENLAREGVNIILCSSVGLRAISFLQQLGIEVFVGANGKVKDVIKAWKDGKLSKAGLNNACKEGKHGF